MKGLTNMSIFKVIISLPIIVAKLIWRFILISVISFPISGFVIIPALDQNEPDSLVGVAVIIGILALITSIRVWKKSYDNSMYEEKWIW